MQTKQKAIIISIIGVVFILLIGKFFLSTLGDKLKDLHQQIEVEEKALRHNLEAREKKDVILQEFESYQDYVMKYTYDRRIIAEFLKEVEKLAHLSGVSIINLTPQEEREQQETYKKYTAELRAEAYLEEIINFFYKIQKSNLLIKLDRFSLAPKDKEASTLSLETTISIAVP